MLTFEDTTAAVDGPKDARLEARTQKAVKDMISHAAALSGVDVSSFVVAAAYKAAQSTIDSQYITVIESEADRKALFDALENPPEPTAGLAEAFALRKKLFANVE